ncbi:MULTISPECIES: peptidase C1 [Ramlibacter]|uniref:Peptidase C1 n=1 Tax=Ramlibacter pinisoli TaxID=2682844 RepID=A0A6N8IWJ8_9BURK|nr:MULTISPECIES: peptidase C1 [Ramlibacter]MBA2961400.1 peptidase C1 [Ramlibacter sp. CGMCC 1.13660]MVQ31344.1 peptidase C1 [Ramlibacter pinisoli]
MTQTHLLARGSRADDVPAFKRALAAQLGDEAASFPGLLAPGDLYDADTEAACRRWQAGTGLVADGVAGPHAFTVLGLRQPAALEIRPDLQAVRQLFPQTKPANIVRYLPYVTDALEVAGLLDREMVLAALGTIRAETAGFVPIAEFPSRFNTLAGQPPFSAYEPGTPAGKALGNSQPGDGARYRGRGFVQLTGADNYARYTLAAGVDLVGRPELANSPEVAALLLALFLADHAPAMRAALATGRYAEARRLVNGGAHGLEEFRATVVQGLALWPAPTGAGRRRTRSQRPALDVVRDARKDPVDLRDRLYQPPPLSLPAQHPPAADVNTLFRDYRTLVRNQGRDASCTGYGLACVINFARWRQAGFGPGPESVSARMLYNYARRYDEYAGEDYGGSSCRGALKGWFNHGVCLESDWPDHQRPRYGYARRALQTTLGVYYRIDTTSITDLQAAVLQTHAIYVSAYTHAGWDELLGKAPSTRVPSHAALPLIAFDGVPSRQDGHAFAIVGFNERGFIVQNSWGPAWGLGGFAVLGYADWLANAMDAWVASLGVPGVVQGRLAAPRRGAGAAAGEGVDQGRWWLESRAYEHSVVVGNDGRVDRYAGPDELTRTLQHQGCALPDRWFRDDPVAASAPTRRLVLYAHGGLNSEAEAIERARAMGRYFTGNGCYPLFLVWKTGLAETLCDLVEDAQPVATRRAGGLLDAVTEVTDGIIEGTLGRGAGRRVWGEMKENARFACQPRRAGDLLADALQGLAATWGDALEIHLVGHSAGAIILGHLLELLAARGLAGRVASCHLYAPACTVEFANRYYAPQAGLMQRLWLDILSDQQEKDDNVAGLYRKSLLYLVSNALEPDRRTPLLGLERVLDAADAGWEGSSQTAQALQAWRDVSREVGLATRTGIVAVPRVPTLAGGGPKTLVRASHGSFDNNIDTVAATLARITGAPLRLPVDDLRGF